MMRNLCYTVALLALIAAPAGSLAAQTADAAGPAATISNASVTVFHGGAAGTPRPAPGTAAGSHTTVFRGLSASARQAAANTATSQATVFHGPPQRATASRQRP